MALSILSSAPAVPEQTAYRWPLDLPRVLTSSFCEYRGSGFHMGIDLRTGAPGKPVYAAGDGYVERVRCSPWGYGKAVYLRLDDGHTIVYAHLSDYASELRDYVRAAQHARKSYEVNLYPEKDRFRVSRGDAIARSGQTGIGAPHLHMEIRSPAGEPIDPRAAGFDWPDTVAPTIRHIAVEPARSDVRLNGQHRRLLLEQRSAEEVVDLSADGPLRISVYGVDSAGARGTRLGILRASLHSGDRLLQSVHFERMPYADQKLGAITFHPYLLDRGRFVMLWTWPGSSTQPYREDIDEALPNPDANVTATVVDMHGNESRATLRITPDGSRAPGPRPSPPESPVAFYPQTGWIVADIQAQGQLDFPPRVELLGPRRARLPVTPLGDGRYQSVIVPPKHSEKMNVLISHPGITNVVRRFHVVRGSDAVRTVRDGSVELDIGGWHVFGTTIISVAEDDDPSPLPAHPVSAAYTIWHRAHPLAEDVTARIPLDETGLQSDKVHVYRRGDRGKWKLLPTRVNGHTAEFETGSFGTFRALQDTDPPALRIRQASGRAMNRRPELSAAVVDEASRIDSYGATANGEWLLVAYDPEHEELRWEQDEDLPSGDVRIVFHATDPAGNRAERSIDLQIP